MQRVIVFLCLACLFVSCSVFKKGSSKENIVYSGTLSVSNVTDINVSSLNFDIQKISIELMTSDGSQSFMANLKYRIGGEYLISLRSKMGIEIARISLKDDSIFVFDRINRILYEEDGYYFLNEFGFDISFLSLIFGNVLLDGMPKDEIFSCNNGNTIIINRLGEINVKYDIDCSIKKPNEILIYENSSLVSSLMLSDYFEIENYFFPAKVYLNTSNDDYSVSLDYANIIINPSTKMIFNIPDDIERRKLY